MLDRPCTCNVILWGVRVTIIAVDSQKCILYIVLSCMLLSGYAVAQLVEALRYRPEGRGFDSRWGHWNFSVT